MKDYWTEILLKIQGMEWWW